MLSQADLTGALHEALKAASPQCGCFCTASIAIDGDQLIVAHNGTGNRDTNVQRVYAPKTLGLAREPLATLLTTWVNGVHRAKTPDLNAGA